MFRDNRSQKEPYIKAFFDGKIDDISKNFDSYTQSRAGTGDDLVWRLELATVLFEAGRYEKSLKQFEQCEAIIRDYDNRASINIRGGGDEGLSAVTNPNSVSYKGMFLDRLMINAYKALDYFALGKPSEAQVELRRMRDNQKIILKRYAAEILHEEKKIDKESKAQELRIEDGKSVPEAKKPVSFSSISQNKMVQDIYDESARRANKLYGSLGNPFITYLSAVGYLLDHNYGEALVDFRNLYRMVPDSELVKRDYVTAAWAIGSSLPAELSKVKPFDYPLDKKIVFVIVFNGRAPALKEKKFQIVLPFTGYTGVAVPVYEYFPTPSTELVVSGGHEGKISSAVPSKLADFDAIMSQEYHDRMPAMITRIVVSTLTKEAASMAAVLAAKQAGDGAMIAAYILTGLYKYLFNTADTRGWETLPGEVRVAQIPMPADHTLNVGFATDGKKNQKDEAVHIKDSAQAAILYIRILRNGKYRLHLFSVD